MGLENRLGSCGGCYHFSVRNCRGEIASEEPEYSIQVTPEKAITVKPVPKGHGFCKYERGATLGIRDPNAPCGFVIGRGYRPIVDPNEDMDQRLAGNDNLDQT